MQTGCWMTWRAWTGQTASRTCSGTGSAGLRVPASALTCKVLRHPALICMILARGPAERVAFTPLVLAWAGREGANPASDAQLDVFTTRPDTIFGATYMVIAPEHPLLEGLTAAGQAPAVQEYVQRAAMKSDLERTELQKVKTGVFTGVHPCNFRGASPCIRAAWLGETLVQSALPRVLLVPACRQLCDKSRYKGGCAHLGGGLCAGQLRQRSHHGCASA